MTILMTEFWLTTNTARMTQFDHLHESQSSVEEGKSANSDDRILTDDGYSTNNSNNPYRFDHLQESQSSVEEGKSAENKAVTDAGMINKEQNVPNLPGGGGEAPTKTSNIMKFGSLRPLMIWMRLAFATRMSSMSY